MSISTLTLSNNTLEKSFREENMSLAYEYKFVSMDNAAGKTKA